jgi:hypothetical protein
MSDNLKRLTYRFIRGLEGLLRPLRDWADPSLRWDGEEWHDAEECVGCDKPIDICCEEWRYADDEYCLKIHDNDVCFAACVAPAGTQI